MNREEEQLKEILGSLMSLAKDSDDCLTKGQIEDACGRMNFSTDQMDLICAYLEMNKVTIVDFRASMDDRSLFHDSLKQDKPEEDNSREADNYKMYLDEVKDARCYSESEEQALLLAAAEGDEDARERLIEGNLGRVVDMAQAYLGHGVPVADLVQEGNVALVLSLDTYVPGENFTVHVLEEIEDAMVEAIREQTGADDIGLCLAADANALMKATERLTDELDREPTASELAEYMHMSRDRVDSLLKMSLDAMNLSDG